MNINSFGGRARNALKIIATISILCAVGYQLDWLEVWGRIAQCDFVSLLIASLFAGMVFAASIVRWQLLLKVQGIFLSLRLVAKLTFIGLFFNMFLLGAAGGDLLKIWYATKHAPTKRIESAGSIIADRILGLLVLVLLGLLAMFWKYPFIISDRRVAIVLMILTLIFAVVAIVLAGIGVTTSGLMHISFRAWWQRFAHRQIVETWWVTFRKYGEVNQMTLGAVVASVIGVIFAAIEGIWIAKGVGITASYLEMFVVLAFVALTTSLPVSFAGHGVREVSFIAAFTVFDNGLAATEAHGLNEAAVLFSIAFFLINAIWGAVGGIIWIRGARNEFDS